MSNKFNIELGYVQLTLLLPLWGRAIELKKQSPALIDSKAAEIIEKIDYDFTKIANNIHPVTQFEWIARSIHIDRAIKNFLENHPCGTIVNIGCGLDTTFERVDNGKLHWYDLDFEDVIALRRKFISENERRKFIASSFLNESWFDEIYVEDSILFMAAGVFYYLEEKDLQEIFKKLIPVFPNSEMIFDAASPLGVKTANEKVIEGSGLDKRSHLKWGIQNADEILEWNNKIELVNEIPMYKNMVDGLSQENQLAAEMSDKYKIMYMIHLRFAK